MQYFSCRGEWNKCQLVVTATREHENEQQELYQFLPRSRLITELGSEELADDLITRHKEAEAKLSTNKKGKFIKPYLTSFKMISFQELMEYNVEPLHTNFSCCH